MSHLRDRNVRRDRFHQKAKDAGFAARSVYKLMELDKRFHLLKSGACVLDLGCRPGSWLQHACDRVGLRGKVVGIDRTELEIALPANATVIVGNVFEISPADLLAPLGDGRRFNLVLSDMAPDTSGVAFTDQVRSVELYLQALAIAQELSTAASAFVGKVFMGEGFTEAVRQTRVFYRRVKTVKPEATRSISSEQYIVGQERK